MKFEFIIVDEEGNAPTDPVTEDLGARFDMPGRLLLTQQREDA